MQRLEIRDCRREAASYTRNNGFGCCSVSKSSFLVFRFKNAFTIIELLIAMSILSVGIVGAMQIFPVGLKASQRSKMKSRAALVAQRSIESLKLKPWDELKEGESKETVDEFEVTSRIRSLSIEALTDPSRMKAFEVEVNWKENDRQRQLSFMTYAIRQEAAIP